MLVTRYRLVKALKAKSRAKGWADQLRMNT
jgi:hypothetical protein